MRLHTILTTAALALLHGAADAHDPEIHPTGNQDGFELAMRFSSRSQFTFNSPYWTNCDLLNASDQKDDKDADGKYHPFVNVEAKEIMACLPHGCVKYTLQRPHTLQQLFSKTPVSSSQNLQFHTGPSAAHWTTISGATGLTKGWTGIGLNYDDDKSAFNARVRFGVLFNNEGSVSTANDAVGFGATEASGQSVGAGWTRHPGHKVATKGTIWVKGDKAVKPCEPGFELAMRFSSRSQFTFDSAYWTNCALLDASDKSLKKDADGKFAAFTDIEAKEIMACLPNGCVKYRLQFPETLHELFTKTPVSSSANLQFGPASANEWAAISGAADLTSGWTGTGINFRDDQARNHHARVRLGALFNNEGSVATANDAVGFGATEATGQAVGAGWTRHPGHKISTMGTIWVKGARTARRCK